MKRYSAAQARSRLSDALDAAEAGAPVIIERRGIRFHLVREAKAPRRTRRAPMLDILDPAVERGEWTWSSGRRGFRFTPRPPVGRAR